MRFGPYLRNMHALPVLEMAVLAQMTCDFYICNQYDC